MKLTIEQAMSIEQAIKSVENIKLPARASYRLARLLDSIQPFTKQFTLERSDLVVNKYGKKIDEDRYEVDPAKMESYLIEIKKMLEKEESIENFTPISIRDFDGVDLPVAFFRQIGKLIID